WKPARASGARRARSPSRDLSTIAGIGRAARAARADLRGARRLLAVANRPADARVVAVAIVLGGDLAAFEDLAGTAANVSNVASRCDGPVALDVARPSCR